MLRGESRCASLHVQASIRRSVEQNTSSASNSPEAWERRDQLPVGRDGRGIGEGGKQTRSPGCLSRPPSCRERGPTTPSLSLVLVPNPLHVTCISHVGFVTLSSSSKSSWALTSTRLNLHALLSSRFFSPPLPVFSTIFAAIQTLHFHFYRQFSSRCKFLLSSSVCISPSPGNHTCPIFILHASSLRTCTSSQRLIVLRSAKQPRHRLGGPDISLSAVPTP